MKPTLIALFALSVAVFADDTNRFQIITHINIDGSLGVMKLDRQTGKTWRYENRVGPEIIISEEGQALREQLGKIIIPRVDPLSDFTMEEAIQVFQAVVKQNDHLHLQKHNPVPKPNSSSGENNAQSKTNKPRIQPRFNGGNIGTNSIPQIPGGLPGGIDTLPPTGRQTNSLPMIPGSIPGGLPGVLPGGLHLNIIIIPVEKLLHPSGGSSGVDPTTGMPMGVGSVGGGGGVPQIDPTTGKPLVDSNSTGKLRPNRQPGGVGGERRNPMVDPTTGLPAGVGPGRAAWPGGGGLPGMGGGLSGFPGGLPGMGVGVPESIYELDPTTVKVKGIKSDLHNLSAFSLLHILLNSLDYPVQCIIDRHGIFLMPIGHPFIFLNGKPAETKNKSRWVLVGERGG